MESAGVGLASNPESGAGFVWTNDPPWVVESAVVANIPLVVRKRLFKARVTETRFNVLNCD